MTLTLTIRSGLAWLFRRHTSEVTTMPTTITRPDWRAVASGSRDWAPVYDEPQTIIVEYSHADRIDIVRFMPGGRMTESYDRNRDGTRGRYNGWRWDSEPEADWPITKALLEAAE